MLPGRRSALMILVVIVTALFTFTWYEPSYAVDGGMLKGSYISPEQPQTTVVHDILTDKDSISSTGTSATQIYTKSLSFQPSYTGTFVTNLTPTSSASNMDELEARILTNLNAYKTSFAIAYSGDTTNLAANISARIEGLCLANPELNYRIRTWGYTPYLMTGGYNLTFACTYWPAVSGAVSATTVDELTYWIQDMLENGAASKSIRYSGDNTNITTTIGTIMNDYLNTPGNDYRKFTIKTYTYSYYYGRYSGVQIDFKLSYWESAEQTSVVEAQVQAALAKIINDTMTTEQKIKAINDYIVLTTAYDTSLVQHSAYASVTGGKTVCQGYALLAYRMLDDAGIPVRIISGMAGTTGHAWNLVQIDGNWYHLDCTWNDPVPDVKGRISYRYFALSDGQISSSRTWNNAAYPVCGSAYTATDGDIGTGYRYAVINSIDLDKSSTIIPIGMVENLDFSLNPSTEVWYKATWTSTNPTVATVTNGFIQGLKTGTTTIIATSMINNKSDYCQVVVKPVLVTGLTLDKETDEIKVGAMDTLTARLNALASDTKVLWKSSNALIATVDAYGKVKGIKAGTAVITATSNDGKYTDSCDVTVVPVLVDGITLDASTASIEIGATRTLKAAITPTNVTNKLLTWTSDNEAVATVASTGIVKALLVGGTATITAAAKDGSGQSASCVVTVTAKAKGVSLSPIALTIEKGDSAYAYTTIPSGAVDIACKSSNTSIVTAAMNSDNSAVVVTAPAQSIGGTATVTFSAKINGVLSYTTCSVKVPNRVSGLTLSATTAQIATGTKKTLMAVVSPTTATNKTVTWSSSDNSIATVDSKGIVTGVAPGTATITAASADVSSITADCTITVTNVTATAFSITPATLVMKVGETKPLVSAFTPATATDKSITWSSGDTSIATVDNSGKVTAVGVGTVVITATCGDGLSDTCAVTIAAGSAVTAIKVDKITLTIYSGQTGQLKAVFTPLMPADRGASWTSDNEAVATVEGATGLVTAVSAGTAKITVRSDADPTKSAYCMVTVITRVTGVSLDQTLIEELPVGSTVQLIPAITPSDASNLSVAWLSSNAAVAAVSTTGVVTGKSPGVATITVTTLDGKYTAICRVVVLPVLVTGVSLNKSSTNLAVAGTEILTATILPANATTKTMTWSSSSPTYVSVANGKITGLKATTAPVTITVTTNDGKFSDTCEVTVGS